MSDYLTELFRGVIPGAVPNGWQRRLYRLMLEEGRAPGAIRAPTSGGKTAILIVYLAVLASQARDGPVSLPRRIVMVINRRALVDQATSLAEKIRIALDLEALTPLRAASDQIKAMIATIRKGLDHIRATALQLPKADRWRALIRYIVAQILRLKPHRPPLSLALSPPLPA